MRHRVLSLLLFLAAGCESPSAIELPPEGGTWRLVALDGRPVPVEPTPRLPGTGCRKVYTAGRFALDAARRRYSYHYDIRSACDGSLLNRASADGSYVPGPGGRLTDPERSFLPFATLQGDTVSWRTLDGVIAFADRGEPVGLVVGTFHFQGAEDDVGEGACDRVVAGSLMLSLDVEAPTVSGTYQLLTHSEDACVGGTTNRQETGTYEQVDRLLAFRTMVGPNEFFEFRGEIRPEEIVLLRGGVQSDLSFGW